MSRERWKPSLTTLYIYLTQRCNLLCRHCYIAPSYSTTTGKAESEIEVAPLLDFIDEAIPLGLRFIKISGGEPFLRWQDVLSISRHVKERGIRIAIETNGTLINDELADALVQAGVNFISISLDGATAETHEATRGVRGCYEEAVREIERLSSRGIHVQIITVLTKRNIYEWRGILELGKERGADSVKFNLLVEIGRAESIAEDERVSIEEYIRLYDEILRKDDESIRIMFDVPPAFQKIGDLVKEGIYRRCPILNLLSVLADGSISICGMGERSEKLIIGKVGSSNLKDLWEHHPLLRDLRMTVPEKLEGVCSMCVFRNRCLGHCRAIGFAKTQSLVTPYSFCQRAFDSGLFPENRLRDIERKGGDNNGNERTSPTSTD